MDQRGAGSAAEGAHAMARRALVIVVVAMLAAACATGTEFTLHGRRPDPDRLNADAAACLSKTGITPEQWESLEDRPDAQAKSSVAIIKCMDALGYRAAIPSPVAVMKDVDLAFVSAAGAAIPNDELVWDIVNCVGDNPAAFERAGRALGIGETMATAEMASVARHQEAYFACLHGRGYAAVRARTRQPELLTPRRGGIGFLPAEGSETMQKACAARARDDQLLEALIAGLSPIEAKLRSAEGAKIGTDQMASALRMVSGWLDCMNEAGYTRIVGT